MTSNTTQRGNMNPRRQKLKNVTHEEIENAMKRYLDNGGTIKHLDTPYDNPNLNYDSMDHEERQMVYEITGIKKFRGKNQLNRRRPEPELFIVSL